MNHKGHEVSRRILYQQIPRDLASFVVQMENLWRKWKIDKQRFSQVSIPT